MMKPAAALGCRRYWVSFTSPSDFATNPLPLRLPIFASLSCLASLLLLLFPSIDRPTRASCCGCVCPRKYSFSAVFLSSSYLVLVSATPYLPLLQREKAHLRSLPFLIALLLLPAFVAAVIRKPAKSSRQFKIFVVLGSHRKPTHSCTPSPVGQSSRPTQTAP